MRVNTKGVYLNLLSKIGKIINMKAIVVDSSVMVKWLSVKGELDFHKARQILKNVQLGKVTVLAPELAKYEVGNAILNKRLTLQELLDSLDVFYRLSVEFFVETEELSVETYKIAQESGITYYDAAFVALAKSEGVVLVTANPKHHQKIRGVNVLPLGEYK